MSQNMQSEGSWQKWTGSIVSLHFLTNENGSSGRENSNEWIAILMKLVEKFEGTTVSLFDESFRTCFFHSLPRKSTSWGLALVWKWKSFLGTCIWTIKRSSEKSTQECTRWERVQFEKYLVRTTVYFCWYTKTGKRFWFKTWICCGKEADTPAGEL